jgi:hypothetical protein
MSDFDLFFVFRRALAIFCTVYTVVRTTQSIWRWNQYLSPAHRSTNLTRNYLLLHLIRIRVHRFTLELLQIAGLAALFVYLVSIHPTTGSP